MIICELCKKEFKNLSGLGLHLTRFHKYDKKEYYKKYLSKDENEGVCYCGKETKFHNLVKGFSKYCSISCVNKSEEHINKIKETNLEKYGVENVFQSEMIKDKIKKVMVDKYGVEHNSQTQEYKIKFKNTMNERYGVDHALQSKDIRDKFKNTMNERYDVSSALQNKEIKDKIKKTNQDRYGCENVFQNEEIKDKIKKTNLEKYGYENVSQSEEIRERVKETSLKKFGCENPFQNEEIKDKIKETNLDKFGVENVSQNKEIREKVEQTCLEKFGVRHFLQNKEVRIKIKETNLKKYGYLTPLQNEEIQKRIKENNLIKYGVENVLQNKEIQDKIKETNIKKYGVEYSLQNEEVRKKQKQTNLEKYGVEHSLQNKEVRDKIKGTNLDKYGFESPLQNREIQDKINKTRCSQQYKNYIENKEMQNRVEFLFTEEEYVGSKKSKYKFRCKKCDTIFMGWLKDGLLPRCLNCYPLIINGISRGEKEVYDFVKKNYDGYIVSNDKTVLNKKELDLYLPNHKLAIEYNGLYWHSELNGKDKLYHIDKLNKCTDNDIELIQIFEDEWLNKKDIVSSILLYKLNKTPNKIYARKCKVKEMDSKTADIFLTNNHVQGSIQSKINIALFYDNEIVSILTIGKPRFNKQYEYEIYRFCNKIFTNVIGGLSKLFKYFIRTYNPNSIITYADRRYFDNNNSYKILDFEYKENTKPNYFYLDSTYQHRYSRHQFQKHKLKNKLDNFDNNLSEWENMQLNFYDRIWDCGTHTYIWNK